MKTHQKILLLSAACALTASICALGTQLKSAPGYHIINASPFDYTTTNPTGCANVAFPATIKANELNPNSDNAIVITQQPNNAILPSMCTTTYTSATSNNWQPAEPCVVTVKMNQDGTTALYASGLQKKSGCKVMSGGGTVVMQDSSSS